MSFTEFETEICFFLFPWRGVIPYSSILHAAGTDWLRFCFPFFSFYYSSPTFVCPSTRRRRSSWLKTKKEKRWEKSGNGEGNKTSGSRRWRIRDDRRAINVIHQTNIIRMQAVQKKININKTKKNKQRRTNKWNTGVLRTIPEKSPWTRFRMNLRPVIFFF